MIKSDSVDSADGSKGVEPVELSDGWPSSPDGHCDKSGRDAQHVVCGVGQWEVSGAGLGNYTLLRQVGSGTGAEVVRGGGGAEESAIEGLDVWLAALEDGEQVTDGSDAALSSNGGTEAALNSNDGKDSALSSDGSTDEAHGVTADHGIEGLDDWLHALLYAYDFGLEVMDADAAFSSCSGGPDE